jgi:hypothetical protein
MKIGQLLDAIEVTSLKPKSFPDLLIRSWTLVRFGRDMIGKHKDAEALGKKLLAQTDFFKARSGLTDEHRVVFAIEDLKRDHLSLNKQAFIHHLEWMVDSRRNPETIRLVLDAYRLPTKKGAKNSFPEVFDLHRLAGDLAAGLSKPEEKGLTEALLTGRLYLTAEKASELESAGHTLPIRRIREMMVMWAILDLQIIVARLFHAEWRALENDDPTLIRLSSVHNLIQKLVKQARAMERAFNTGKDNPKLTAKVEKFLDEHDLRKHARRNGFSMGLTQTQMMPGGASPKIRGQVKRYLQHVRKAGERIVGGFEASMDKDAKSPTRLEYAKSVNQTGKRKLAASPFHSWEDVDGIREARMNASTSRFSMPVLTALVYAIQRVTATIGSMPGDRRIAQYTADPNGPPEMWSEQDQLIIKSRLIDVYRNLFVRDHRRIADEADETDDCELTAELDRSFLDDDDGQHVLVKPSSARHLPEKIKHILGVGYRPDEMVDHSLNGAGTGRTKKRKYRDAIMHANILDGYRQGTMHAPEEAYVGPLFESSVGSRIKAPDKKKKK